jgi:DNA invertase Pin-like site-specific DNA recombinase
VFGAIAHFERWLIAERIKDGIAAALRAASGQDVNPSMQIRSRRP